MIAQKRDINEPDIVNPLRNDLKVTWIPMDKDAGFDGLVIWRGRVHIVEIKNPEYLTKKGVEAMLTENEKETKRMVEAAGGVYNIWLTLGDALRTLGVM